MTWRYDRRFRLALNGSPRIVRRDACERRDELILRAESEFVKRAQDRIESSVLRAAPIEGQIGDNKTAFYASTGRVAMADVAVPRWI